MELRARHLSSLWRMATASALLLFAVGCPGGGRGADTAADGIDGSADVEATDVSGETRGDGLDASRCSDPPECDPGERLVECSRCVSTLNRVCEVDAECRPGEECRMFDGTGVCIYEPGPVETCPGSEGCRSGGNGPFEVGAASRVVTPQGYERPKPAGVDDDNYMTFGASSAPDDKWHDCGRDGLCPGDEGYDSPDQGEDDGIPQGMWLAGFSNGRPAQYCPPEKVGCSDVDCCVSKYAHDNLKVQVAVLRRGDTTVAFASVDTLGWFHTDVEAIRERLPEELEVDLLVMAGTHNHEAPDPAGQWGPGGSVPERSGRHPKFIEKVYRQTVEGIRAAVEDLRAADVEAGVVDDGIDGMAMGDSRPPYIFDDNIPVLRFTEQGTDSTIATILSLGNHAEVLWNDNPYITADYPHYVREYVREGVGPIRDDSGQVQKPELEGFGGVTVFFAGAVGGLINPGGGDARDYAGDVPSDQESFEAADALGQQVAHRVLSASDNGEFRELTDPSLAFAHKEFTAPIRNRLFQLAAFQLGVLERDVYNAARLGWNDYVPGPPEVLSEVDVVRIGDATIFTAPGEVFPETLTGGFPGKSTVQDPVVGDVLEEEVAAQCDADGLPVSNGSGTQPCIVEPDQENPPDWSRAPDPPYVYGRIPGDIPMFVGLGGDFVGYMVPNYDYEYTDYQDEAPGSHYEETNGLGPEIIGKWKENLNRALGALPE